VLRESAHEIALGKDAQESSLLVQDDQGSDRLVGEPLSREPTCTTPLSHLPSRILRPRLAS
jgi:hypothetical protein